MPPQPWSAAPIGPTLTDSGAGFSVYAPDAASVELLLFAGPEDDEPADVISHDRGQDRIGPWWHTFVPGLAAGQVYGYRVVGHGGATLDSKNGSGGVLIDPYGRGVAVPAGYRRETGPQGPGRVARSLKSVLIDTDRYDWEGDRPLGRPLRESVIYEAHVRGMTANPNSGVTPAERGTYRGLITRIPYLTRLGITAIELLPVHQFDALAAPPGLVNYWGYQTVSFFAPHAAYASRRDAQAVADEFRDMVKAFHRAGIEVILDVVFNHTAEGGADGPTFCWRGLADSAYYSHEADGRYVDDSGCGNTLDAGHPIVRRMVLDSLRYWVSVMHVDGFRFDLAAALSRGLGGQPSSDAPLIRDIEADPVLAGTKLIAEAWDAGGLYQVGDFAGQRWSEWNGRFRDDVRSFVKSDAGYAGRVAQRLVGSPDIYAARQNEPARSINFVACHDGLTLNDLVTYARKRNDANGEGGRDGSDDDRSWDCGVDGPSADPEVERLRARQVRNFLALTFLSLGVPMLQMGDEVRRSQSGNNNGYCHDDETTWFDWSLPERHADLLDFSSRLINLRRRVDGLLAAVEGRSLSELLAEARVEWSGVRVGHPDLGPDSRSIALTLHTDAGRLHIIASAWWQNLDFELPQAPDGWSPWRRILDTTQDAVTEYALAADIPAADYRVGPRSVVCLATRPPQGRPT
jgi:isoamylase